jgi:hypothetical protein
MNYAAFASDLTLEKGIEFTFEEQSEEVLLSVDIAQN